MKVLAIIAGLFAAFVIFDAALAAKLKEKGYKSSLFTVTQPKLKAADLCPVCIQFAQDSINALLNIILNVDLMGTCQILADALSQATGSALIGNICDILCVAVGIDEFIHVLNRSDIDPIFFCENVKACPVFDNGDANITEFSAHPNIVQRGETVNFTLTYNSKNGTGTGELLINVDTVDKVEVGQAFVLEPQPPGLYYSGISLSTEKDPNCQDGPCETWKPGLYNITVSLCNGMCGSKHPHSKVYSTAKTSFTVKHKQ